MCTWTVDEMLEEGPCGVYTRERISDLWAGRKSLSLLDICHLDIPPQDIIWVATNPSAIGAYKLRGRWLIDKVVNPVVEKHCLHCGVSDVEDWAAKWLIGKDRSVASAEAARASARWRSLEASEAARAAWCAAQAASADTRINWDAISARSAAALAHFTPDSWAVGFWHVTRYARVDSAARTAQVKFLIEVLTTRA